MATTIYRNRLTWNWNLVLFMKTTSRFIAQRFPHYSKCMFSGTRGSVGWMAINISKCNLFPYRAQYGSLWQITFRFSKVVNFVDYELKKNSLHNTCPFPLSKSECNLQYPKDLPYQFPCIWMSTLVVIRYPDSWGAFSLWSLTISAINNFPLHLWSLIARGAG